MRGSVQAGDGDRSWLSGVVVMARGLFVFDRRVGIDQAFGHAPVTFGLALRAAFRFPDAMGHAADAFFAVVHGFAWACGFVGGGARLQYGHRPATEHGGQRQLRIVAAVDFSGE